MDMPLNRMWRLAARPVGDVKDDDLSWHEAPAREPAAGEVLVEVMWLALDPSQRTWMNEMPLVGAGSEEAMRGTAFGKVLRSRSPDVPEGVLVSGMMGWQTHATVPAQTLYVHRPEQPYSIEDYLGAVNEIGATAYFAVRDGAALAPGQTVLITGASGGVGSLAGQLARRRGARVVGIAATETKSAWLTQLGFDAVIDRLAEDVGPGIDRTCPDGIDAIIDVVGGSVLDAALARLRPRARVVLCGSSATQNSVGRVSGPTNFGKILERGARVVGLSVLDYVDRWEEALTELGTLVSHGQLRYRLDVIEGLPNAVIGFRRLFSGENMGRMVVRVGAKPM